MNDRVVGRKRERNKEQIMSAFGFRLNILVQLSLSRDSITQEHAVEALAELLTIPSIQVR